MDIDHLATEALAPLKIELRQQIAKDPAHGLAALGLTVRASQGLARHRNGGGACDGMSFLDEGVVLYTPTPGSRREHFTLTHELGHWLVEENTDLLDTVANEADPSKVLETVCDRIAQQLLLPPGTIDHLRLGPVRAQDVEQLFEETAASLPVCAIAVARQLSRLGAVTILNACTRRVETSSVRPDPHHGWPRVFPWPGQTIPGGHHLAALGPGTAFTGRSFWRTGWNEEQPYYIDAIRRGPRIIAVFSDLDVWNSEKLHLDAPRAHDSRPEHRLHCCGEEQYFRAYPCERCRQPACPKCGRCACQRLEAREITCPGCFTRYLPHLIVDGLCQECSA